VPPTEYAVQVRFSDVDHLGHVNHARHLSFFEDARMALIAASPSGLPGSPADRGCIAARLTVDYLRPVTYQPGEAAQVRTWVARIGRSSWTLTHQLWQDDALAARCDVVLVAYDYAAGSARLLDDDERAWWERHRGDA
jgi:acyl-CoA thioester hydrolase